MVYRHRVCSQWLEGMELPYVQREYTPGENVISSSEDFSELYIIKKGAVSMRRDILGQTVEMTTLGAGSIVGDLRILSNTASSADIVALDSCVLYAIPKVQFMEHLDSTHKDLSSLMSATYSEFPSSVYEYISYYDVSPNSAASRRRSVMQQQTTTHAQGKLVNASEMTFIDTLRKHNILELIQSVNTAIKNADDKITSSFSEDKYSCLGINADEPAEDAVCQILLQAVNHAEVPPYILQLVRIFLETWLIYLSRGEDAGWQDDKHHGFRVMSPAVSRQGSSDVLRPTIVEEGDEESSGSKSGSDESESDAEAEVLDTDYLSVGQDEMPENVQRLLQLNQQVANAQLSSPRSPNPRRSSASVTSAHQRPLATLSRGLGCGGARTTMHRRSSMGRGTFPDPSTILNQEASDDAVSNPIIDSWEFDVLRVESKEKLKEIAYDCFVALNLISKYRLDRSKLREYLDQVAEGYNDVLYHNFYHGVDVMVACYWIIQNAGMSSSLCDNDVLALMLASIGHDCCHPGHNNEFEVSTKTELAEKYRNQSVLENLHTEKTLAALESTGVIDHLPDHTKEDVLQTIREAILATDMAKHFNFIKDAEYLGDVFNRPSEWKSQEERLLLVHLLIKMADLSNPAKPFNVAVVAASRIMEELFRQGDREKELSLPVPKTRDREQIAVIQSQIDFITFCVKPLVPVLVRSFPSVALLHLNLTNNVNTYKTMEDDKDFFGLVTELEGTLPQGTCRLFAK
eukprot:GFYU01000736.1.p1 GENE.GFYU01000736.1~~GFYU01000736.1.p1  ORF type:complete len:744 (+),score=146.00 GFYU01000736.1:205-2436(+)